MNLSIDDRTIAEFVGESAGSPQLMQTLCLTCCHHLDVRDAQPSRVERAFDEAERHAVLEKSAAVTSYRTLVDILDAGPKTRGTERLMYRLKDGTSADVYRCVLRALAADPPRLSFEYSEILRRVSQLCDVPPVGSSLVGSCLHMSKLAEEKSPQERVIDWDEEKQRFDIADPYFLFYLRWSGRLKED